MAEGLYSHYYSDPDEEKEKKKELINKIKDEFYADLEVAYTNFPEWFKEQQSRQMSFYDDVLIREFIKYFKNTYMGDINANK